jgi:hypothetical protein
MDNYPHSALAYLEQEKHRNEIKKQEQLKEQKFNKHNEDSLNIAKDTKNIEKENLIVSKRTFWIATSSLVVSIIAVLIALFK